QGQLRPGNDTEAVNCTGIWDPGKYPWVNLADLFVNEVLTFDDLDNLKFDANRTHASIALPLATNTCWEGLQADNYASLGHVRALVYASAQKVRSESPAPHVN